MPQSSGFIQRLRRLAVVMGFASLVMTSVGHAEQLISDDLRLKTGDTPTLFLEQDTTMGFSSSLACRQQSPSGIGLL